MAPTNQPVAAQRKEPRLSREFLPWITTPTLTILIVLAWHFYVTQAQVSKFILPSPWAVLEAWLDLLQSPRAWGHVLRNL